jgi:hypothetical protein
MATSSYFGRNAFCAVAEEDTAYGTADETYTVKRPIISCSMLRALEKVPRPNLQVAGVNGLRKGHFIAKETCTGTLELEATYDNIGYFIRRLMGTGSTASGTPNTHSYYLGDVPDIGTSLALQRGTDDNYELFEGVVMNVGTFSVASGESMSLSLEMIAETGQARKSSPGLSYADPTYEELILHNDLTSVGLDWNSQNIELIDFEFKIENGLAERMRLGSTLTKKPVSSDYRTASCTVTFETDDATYASFLADTQGDLFVEFSNATRGGTGASLRTIKFGLNEAYIESFTDEVTETGLVTASVVFKGEANGTSALALGASIDVQNQNGTDVHNG